MMRRMYRMMLHVVMFHVVVHDRRGMAVCTVISSEMMMVVAGAEDYEAYCCETETENFVHFWWFLLVKVVNLV